MISTGVGIGVAIEFFGNPSTASAAEPDRRWSGDLNRLVRVQVRERYNIIAFPRFWNLLAPSGGWIIGSPEAGEWIDLGEMTVGEAMTLEGLMSAEDYESMFMPPPTGTYTQLHTYSQVRITELPRGAQ